MIEVRHNVKLATTWRILAELTRRHPGVFRIVETHPCSGQYDCVSLMARQGDNPFAQHLCDFHVPAQHFHIFEPLSTPQARLSDLAWPDTNDYVLGYLSAPDPRKVVEDIEKALGLPAYHPSGASSAAVLVVRTIAAALERFMLSRDRLDVRCGWYDSGYGTGPTDWALSMPQVREGIAALSETASWEEQAGITSRVWQIRRLAAPINEWGVLMDMKTGMAYAGGEAVLLTGLYEQSGRRLAPLADWVAERIITA
jgi:hypothetical protein